MSMFWAHEHRTVSAKNQSNLHVLSELRGCLSKSPLAMTPTSASSSPLLPVAAPSRVDHGITDLFAKNKSGQGIEYPYPHLKIYQSYNDYNDYNDNNDLFLIAPHCRSV
jgi:hypothetical protein